MYINHVLRSDAEIREQCQQIEQKLAERKGNVIDLQAMYGDSGDAWWSEVVALEEPVVERAKELGLTTSQIQEAFMARQFRPLDMYKIVSSVDYKECVNHFNRSNLRTRKLSIINVNDNDTKLKILSSRKL